MNRRKRNYPEEGFQMAPMIDMVFLLLVFFMCVSSMASSEKSIELDLPESEASKIPEDLSDRGTISLDADGRIFLGSKEITDERLEGALRKLVAEKPDSKVIVRADRLLVFGEIRKVLEKCAEVGAYEIVYATHEQ